MLLCLIKATVFALFLSWCWCLFLLQLWSATTSQQVTHWPKYFSEYQEVRCIWFIPHQVIALNKMWSSCKKKNCMLNLYAMISYVCSWSRSRTCRASFCDLAFNRCINTASLTISKRRETWEGNATHWSFVNLFWLFEKIAVCKTFIYVARCPFCQWCWHLSSSSL